MYRALVGVGMMCGLLIALVYEGTLPIIEKNRAEALEKAVFAVIPGAASRETIDGENLPANVGDTGHEAILRDFRGHVAKLERKMNKLGVPGVFLELEPHLKGGGQFGGFSGPDGMGVAVRGLTRVLDQLEISYDQRRFADVRALPSETCS